MKLQKKQAWSYDSGRIFSSMCTKPLRASVNAYVRFLETNLLDEEIFPNVKLLEDEAIRKVARLFSHPTAGGYITSGGTEGNIVGLWIARKLRKGKKVVAPESVHYSIEKACDLQQVKLVRTKLNGYRASVEDIEGKIDRSTIAIVATAGTTALGLVDPIKQIAEVAADSGCFLHVDASFGGFVLPFLKNPPKWDFSVAGVSSIVADPHKMGMVPIPAGIMLLREREWFKLVETNAPYLSKPSFTLLGTRPGASAAAVWAALNSLGWRGYRRMVRRCMNLTRRLASGIKKIEGLDLIVEPETNVVAFRSSFSPASTIKAALRKRGWVVSLNRHPESVRLVIMPHHSRKRVDAFMRDLKACVEGLS
jgi:tyrosine decarboxylase/aspartate 1-decarboxylase